MFDLHKELKSVIQMNFTYANMKNWRKQFDEMRRISII